MKSIKKNYIYNLIYQMLAILIPIITTPYVSRVLGATAIGDYSYTFGIVSYFGIIALTGTQSFGQREIASKLNDSYQKSIAFWEIFLFRALSTGIVLFVYLIFIRIFLRSYYILLAIQLFTVLSWIFDISWYYQGTENFRFTVIRNSFVKIFATILIFLVVKSQEDLWKYTLILSGSTFLGNCTFWINIRNELQRIKWADIHVFKNIRGIMQLFLPVVAIQIYTVLDQTMLGAFVNTTQVGFYSQGEKIIKLAITIISSLSAVMLPRISILFAAGDFIKIKIYYEKVVSFIFLLATPMLVGCIILCDRFVPIFLGIGYDAVVNIMRILSGLFIILSVGQMFGSFLIAMKKQKIYTKAVVTASIINFVLNCIFISFFELGAIGAAIGTVLAEVVSTIIQVIGAREFFDWRIILRKFLWYLLPGFIMGVVVVGMVSVTNNDIIGLVAPVFVGMTVYFLILMFMKDDILIYIKNSVKSFH